MIGLLDGAWRDDVAVPSGPSFTHFIVSWTSAYASVARAGNGGS